MRGLYVITLTCQRTNTFEIRWQAWMCYENLSRTSIRGSGVCSKYWDDSLVLQRCTRTRCYWRDWSVLIWFSESDMLLFLRRVTTSCSPMGTADGEFISRAWDAAQGIFHYSSSHWSSLYSACRLMEDATFCVYMIAVWTSGCILYTNHATTGWYSLVLQS